jgi:hypothetical protein
MLSGRRIVCRFRTWPGHRAWIVYGASGSTDDDDGLSSKFPIQIPTFAPQGIIPMPITLPYLDDLTISQEAYPQVGSSQHSRGFRSKVVVVFGYCLPVPRTLSAPSLKLQSDLKLQHQPVYSMWTLHPLDTTCCFSLHQRETTTICNPEVLLRR